MSNVFFRTSIAPYRIDTYNSIHEMLDCEMYFYWKHDASQAFDEDIIESKCKFVPNYLKGIRLGRQSRKLCTDVWKILKENSPKFVIVPEFQILTIQVLLYKWLYRKDFKVISMCDDSYDMVANHNDFSKIHRVARRLITPMLDDLILVDSRVCEWYQKNYGKGVWMPIIMDDKKSKLYYSQLLQKSSELASTYALKGKKILLYVGRLVELKNLTRLLEAFKNITSDATLVIVGDGPERKRLEEQAKLIDKEILFTGRFDGDDLYAWYNLASTLILASVQEAFGAVTGEALLAGCRVIVSQRAGSSCLVCKENGEIIDPFDVQGITTAIERQLSLGNIPDLSKARDSLLPVKFCERMDNLKEKIKTL